ncbi:MAG TPA: hypothetical protein DCF89_12810 [Flavobacteriales bacterium]|nr:hypothetical protein [Flavobacteriales bacterium]
MKPIYISILLIIMFAKSTLSQGRTDGFFKGKGNTEIVLGGGAEFAKWYYAGNNRIFVPRTIYNANLFIAAGLFNKVDLYLSAPYVSINGAGSIQDGSAYLKLEALNKKFNSGSLSISMAIGCSGNLANYQTEGLNAIGQQAKVLDFRPVVHYFSNDGWFGTFQFGYGLKSAPVPDCINTALKFGKATAKLYFDIWYDYQLGLGGLDYRGTPAPTTFRELRVDYHKIGATIYTPVWSRLGVFAGPAYVITGRNISQGLAINAGLVLKSD